MSAALLLLQYITEKMQVDEFFNFKQINILNTSDEFTIMQSCHTLSLTYTSQQIKPTHISAMKCCV